MKTHSSSISMLKTIMVFAFVALIFSCSSSDSNNATNQNTVNAVENIAKSGTWRVTYYFDSDHEETSNYSGYNFTFASSNVLTVTNGTNTYTGAWFVTDSNSNDDSIDDLDFNIVFTAPPFMEELSDDWDMISKTSTEIKLIDISGGNGGTDYLTFTRN